MIDERAMTTAPLRIGILGAARIARLFVEGVRPSGRLRVHAVASRDVERAQAFARETGVTRVHSSYDALLADREIDAVYNPLPNTLHAEWSIRAANAGKHVLCEKPLATSASDARAMFDAARANGVYVVEGYPYRAQPQTIKLKELLAAGAIGTVQTVQAAFGFQMAEPANIRLNPALAGGALMDAGCYPVSLVRLVVGERPARVHAVARWSASGVDRSLATSIDFPGGALAQISCSFATVRHRHALIAGSEGSIVTSYFNDTSPAQPPLLELRRQSGPDIVRETIETSAINGFLAEAESFAALVSQGWAHWSGATPDESIDIASMLEAIAASARSGAAVEVAR